MAGPSPGEDQRLVTPSPVLITVLTALNAVAPFSIDMYLSAFPGMARDFNASTSSIQLTLTAFLIGLACGQLVFGPLSDRWGRRPPLIVGTAACLGASVSCAVAPSIEILVGLRFVQGFAAGAGVVIARAIIADRARGHVALRLFSTMNVTAVLAPTAAPLIGGLVVTAAGWRAVFLVLATMNLLALLGVVLVVDESLPERYRRPSGLEAWAASTRGVLASRHYLGYTAATALVSAAMFGYVSASPFVLQNIVGLSPAAYSYTFAACSLAVAAGGCGARLTVKRVAPRRVVVSGVSALVTISALLLATVTLGGVRRGPTIALMGCFMAAIGFVYGHAVMLATTAARHAAGTGSAIFGFSQYAAGAIASPLVGIAGHGTAVPMGVVMLGATLGAAAVLLVLTRGPALAAEPETPIISVHPPP
ncbi:multidrug effflux MFS transporter [Mycolicibacterium stellerae]|uniref:multidrug effflux MFS transporter n=1 Tax=Mycolicibacterium stellerae TaxID=2358193 RepID=UPI001F43E4D6|nr:multidrug effflux MFS transporter [Mycolicibacterium stellerae]